MSARLFFQCARVAAKDLLVLYVSQQKIMPSDFLRIRKGLTAFLGLFRDTCSVFLRLMWGYSF